MGKDKIKILLVDDEKEFVESLSERLALRDLKADVAYDGEQALEALKKEEPDMMILDLRMPGIDGTEVLRRVKKEHPNVEVVILTGHGTDKDEKEAMRLGATAYLKKPIDIDQLVGAVRKEKLKVLLVDDEKEFVESLSERLALRNLEAEVAHDGEEALKAVKEGKPDVMVLDLRMPGINGIEVLRRVKKENPDMAVVILTGHGTDKDEKEAMRLGATAYLKKPVDVDQLVGTLHKAWNRLKKSKRVVDTMLMAAALAQAGATDIARETMAELEEDDDEKKERE
ncbi:MAG: response regulator [Deltaproteobacteria bacterium]|nr:response regulator [Deltaproteobacteria bacterium]MBW2283970.1 response regulator [Deltaproteobacteria bacterium]